MRLRSRMLEELPFGPPDFESRAISPLKELGAYKALWDQKGTSFKKIAQMHRARPGSVPSDFVPESRAYEFADRVRDLLARADINEFGVRVHGAGEYPEKLRDAAYPIELLYFQGWWDLTATRSVAIVGTRKPSREGVARARRLVKELVEENSRSFRGWRRGSIPSRTPRRSSSEVGQ